MFSLRRFPFAALGAGALLAAFAARPAQATTYVMMPDAALADQASVVLDAEVLAAEAAPDYAAMPATDYRIAVARVLKGSVPGSVLVVRVPGGVDPATGIGLKIFGAPELERGERTLLFLRPAADGTYRILHLMLGAFHQRRLGGRTVALRDLAEAHALELPGRVGREGDDLRDFDAFAGWVADRAEGIPAAADYVLGKAPAELGSISGELTYLTPGDGLPIRWFGFDEGRQVAWRVHSGGQPGLGEAATAAAFQVALQSWNDDQESSIRYVYAGTTGAGGGLARADGTNAILFDDPYQNDPAEAVEGTFSCTSGGVIAMGGPFFYSATKTWQGQRYHEAAEGDIVTNDGTDCFFANDPRVAEEVFAHELGHTLGLGHSTNRDALMFASAHDDGRGAQLTADDRAAVRSLYAGTSGGGGGGTTGLAAPARLVARATSPTTAALLWRDKATREEAYVVEVRRRRGRWSVAGSLGANSTGATVVGLQPGTPYSFRVRAVAGGRTSPYSNVAVAVTPR
jgi:hypothetical protein